LLTKCALDVSERNVIYRLVYDEKPPRPCARAPRGHPESSITRNYLCLSRETPKCSLDTSGGRVLIRAKLHYSEMEYERVSLHEPQICELPAS
jgi:hypothetical protein